MQALDFIQTARDLASPRTGRPRETNLRRAVSTTYYALFHCLATCCADMLVGGAGANRSKPAWRQAYRALQHRQASNRCRHENIQWFPNDIQDFANVFVDMQGKRHGADYDPDSAYSKPDVVQGVKEAEEVIRRFRQVPVKDRRAFAVYLLFDIRN